MASDKNWITLRNRRCPEFLKGLDSFMEIASNHVNDEGKAFCPCIHCANSNRLLQDLPTIYAHIHDRGFLSSYTTWVHHGEQYPNAPEIEALWQSHGSSPPIDNEMFDVLADVIAEQNAQDKDDESLDEEINKENVLDQDFDALFKELNNELYPGCNWMSSLSFLAKLMHVKVINNWTNSSFDQILELLRYALPRENRIPASHYEAKKKLRKIGLGYESIHACKYDCCLFYEENASKENSKPKKTRSYGRSLNLYEAYKKNGYKPLPLEYDTSNNLFRPVGDNYQMYVRKISQEVDKEVPYHYPTWKKVDSKYKKSIFRTIGNYFDLKSFKKSEHWGDIVQSIHADCASRFSDRKAGMKKHFDKHGGLENVEEAKRNPPVSVNPEAWGRVIDELFTTPEYINQSIKNKANRAKVLYGSYHGSQSLANRRYKEVKETGHARHVEGWRDMHCKKGKWINDVAAKAWEKIDKGYNNSLLCSGGDKMAVDEVGCLKEALGTRRSYIRGVGRVLKSTTPDVFPIVNRDEEEERWQKQERAMEELRQDNESLKAQMHLLLKQILPGLSSQLEENDEEDD